MLFQTTKKKPREEPWKGHKFCSFPTKTSQRDYSDTCAHMPFSHSDHYWTTEQNIQLFWWQRCRESKETSCPCCCHNTLDPFHLKLPYVYKGMVHLHSDSLPSRLRSPSRKSRAVSLLLSNIEWFLCLWIHEGFWTTLCFLNMSIRWSDIPSTSFLSGKSKSSFHVDMPMLLITLGVQVWWNTQGCRRVCLDRDPQRRADHDN